MQIIWADISPMKSKYYCTFSCLKTGMLGVLLCLALPLSMMISDQKALPFPGNTCLLKYHLPAECFPAPAPTIQNSARHSHCPLALHRGFFPPHLNSWSAETRLGHLRAQPRVWPPRTNSGYLRSTRIDGLGKFQVDGGTFQACKVSRGELGPTVPA